MSVPEEYPWTVHVVWKLLHNDTGTLGLLANNPFPDKPSRYIRAELFRYEFAAPGDPRRQLVEADAARALAAAVVSG